MKEAQIPRGGSVLLRLPNWAGDVVMATACVEAIKKERPDIRIAVAVRRHLVPLLNDYPGINEVTPIEGKGLRANFNLLTKIRSVKYDASIVFAKGFRDGLIARLSGIPARIGYSVNSRKLFFTHPVDMTEELWNSHHALQFLELIKPLGISSSDPRPFLPVTEAGLRRAKEIVSGLGIEERGFLAFHIGASKFPRAYHAERFAEAAADVGGKSGMKIVLIGTGEEKPYIESFKKVFPECVDASGKIALGDLPSFLSLARLFVGNDSGPMHVASAVGTPVVAVFGPGSPAKTAPLLPENRLRIVYSGLKCSPCRQSFFRDCDPSEDGKPPCLELVSSGVLTGRILELLDKS